MCKSKSASIILAPTMCIHRHPLGGKDFQSFSEDPYLTGRLAAAHVKGLQSRRIGASPKHFVANDQETKSFKVNVQIDARALREIYLLPFQMVVRDANPWCMMTAYNKVNGTHCDTSKDLLIDINRKE
ncbi:glycoside hydrolase [Truncatella angustata]|uniref:beta-glucosidase n=1 Tax=Truncatella angustata TaxID=152316 RepID=A0A9P8UHS2_9PEZI|nr:glycoside hydrolase [Truncatella angustata]KAH6652257.1 glycoside hydrolase [Truncatella angustata]